VTSVKTFGRLTSMEEALRLVDGNIRPINRSETVPLAGATGRVLAQDVVAPFSVPRRDRAAMDGYAARAADTVGASSSKPVRLRLVGSVRIGEIPSVQVTPGQCALISTGCLLPKGTDSVIMHENTELAGNQVVVFRPVYEGESVAAAGSDIRTGSTPLREGDMITAAKLGVLASLGVESVRVYQKPRVAVIPTGMEIAKVGSPIDDARVYDINSHTLASVVGENGGIPEIFDPVPDTREDLFRALNSALEHDLVIVAGGSSVGERDMMYELLSDLGRVLFHGVQIKPGKPTICSVVKDRVVMGMPGHPTSCLSNAYLLLMPALRKMARLPTRRPATFKGKLSRRIVSTLGRKVFMTVRVEGEEVEPAFKESSAITSMADADGYIIIPENVDTMEKGDEVEVHLFT